MKTSLSRILVFSTAFVASALVAQAHPGHDGHELTWDFSHLAQHPLATIGCAAFLGVGGYLFWRAMRRPAVSGDQSFRGSQPSRGK